MPDARRRPRAARAAAGLPALASIPDKHFAREDQAPLIARHIAGFVGIRPVTNSGH
jgi:hypothetical protein